MGYGYGMDDRIACDGCGTTGNGTRKRTCPHKVTTSASLGGSRMTLNYCTPPALCSSCFAKEGKTKGVHASCAEGAAASQARYDAEQARLEAGDLLVSSAIYADEVPGCTWVWFTGLAGRQAKVLMASADYCMHAFTYNEYRELGVVRLDG